jgi:hypothetical protein
MLSSVPGSGRPQLRKDHPCATAFLDETGAISKDQIFGIGLLKATEPAPVLRRIQKWRDQTHWYNEIKFGDLTARSLGLYEQVVDLVLDSGDAEFFCFMADRHVADPIERFGSQWDAYSKLAEQLVVASIHPDELVALMADNYSTPDHVLFEQDLRAAVNRRLRRLALVSVCRLDSKSSDGLQIADLLTSAVAFEFRIKAGLAKESTPKGVLAKHVRARLGTTTCLSGWRNAVHSVQIYRGGNVLTGNPAPDQGVGQTT